MRKSKFRKIRSNLNKTRCFMCEGIGLIGLMNTSLNRENHCPFCNGTGLNLGRFDKFIKWLNLANYPQEK